MFDEEKPGYYSIIPAHVRYDSELSPSSKLLFAEITALSNQYGYCVAKDTYFSWLYDVDIRSVQRWLKNLEEFGYITIVKEGKSRRIYANVSPNNYGQKSPVSKSSMTEMSSILDENVHPLINNNIIFIKSLSIDQKRKDIYQEFKFFTKEFWEAWKSFREMRQKKKSPMTVRAEKLNLNEVKKIAGDSESLAIALVDQSVKNGWTGIYELNERKQNTGTTASLKSIKGSGERKEFR